jgi:protein gp37
MINTLIEWATHTLNFWWGCTKVSQACAHCYAETLAKLYGHGRATWGPSGGRWLRFEAAAAELAKVEREAARTNTRPRVFVNSMSDTFESNELLDATRCMMLVLIADTPAVDFLLLTKRPENVRGMVPPAWLEKWPAHVWIGTTVEDQENANQRIPALLDIPACVRFLSCEPLLGPVEFSNVTHRSDCVSVLGKPALSGIHWVIAGGESGAGARPMHPNWARSLRRQCEAVGVPFFFKQWGEWHPAEVSGKRVSISVPRTASRPYPKIPKNPAWHTFDCGQLMARVGKKTAGRQLDGREWNEIPAGFVTRFDYSEAAP